MYFDNIKDYELQNILEVHYNKGHEDIRSKYTGGINYDIVYDNYSIEKNLKNIENYIKEKTDEDTARKIKAVAEMIGAFYRYIYPSHSVDAAIRYNLDSINNDLLQENNSFKKQNESFFNGLTEEDKDVFNNNFDNAFLYRDNNFVLDFNLDDSYKVVVNQVYYKTNDGNIVDLKNDFEGMNLLQVSNLLCEFKLTNAKKYIDNRIKEFIYKKFVINDIYRYIMLYIMDRENNINGAKRALIFAADFNCDKTLPIRYAISFDDNNLYETLRYYNLLNGKDTYCYPDYFDKQNKVIKSKKTVLLSDIKFSSSKKRRR